MPKISVIIPIYNVEEYLAKCLDSVINQTFKDIEILCVNDCSPDNSLAILGDYAQRDNRIKIINREKNGGLSAARNSGLDVAKGDYVYFIDSDDWINIDYLEKMYNAAIESKSEIVLNTNIISYDEIENEYKPMRGWRNNKELYEDGAFLESRFSIANTRCSSCVHLYKKAFIDKHNFRFPEGYIYEDLYFKSITELYVESIYAFYGAAYNYLATRSNSITKADSKVVVNHVKVWKLLYNYYKEHGFLEKYKINYVDIRYLQKIIGEENYRAAYNFLVEENRLSMIIGEEIDILFAKLIVHYNNYHEFQELLSKDKRLVFLRYKKDFLND